MYCIVLVMTQTMTKPTTASRVQVDSKALFARLLASESIVVQHRQDAHTAWFETDTRRLVLPVWQDMTNETYNMLVAHEVAHALYSPKGTDWLDDLTRIDPANAGVVKGYFNVVEDARIERLIKARYPGLRVDFLFAYRSLFDQDKFGLKGKDVSQMSFIDRINLHYKVGVFVDVPFSAEEMPLVSECAETKTYADALDLTRRIYEFCKAQKEQEEQDQDYSEDGQAEASDDGDDTADATETSEGKGEGETDQNAPKGDGESGGSEQQQNGEGGDGKTSDEAGQGKAGAGLGGNTAPDAPTTDNVLNNLSDDHRDEFGTAPYYLDAPIFDEKIGVFTPAEIVKSLDDHPISKNWREKGARYYQEFLTENRDAINLLAREFEQKRAADEFLRTRQADSGSVDPNRLWSYRIDENIFSSYEVKTSGKNHGLIFYVDWSGSMSGILYETVKQALCLAEFCRKVNIPFEVQAFSDHSLRQREDESKWDAVDRQNPWKTQGIDPARASFVQLINFLNGTLNTRQYREAAAAFLYIGKSNSGFYREAPTPYGYSLGGTPLVAAATAALTQLPRFKRQHNLQIVHTVFLTDGGAGDSLYAINGGHGSYPIVRHNGWTSETGIQGQRDWETLKPVLRLLAACNPGTNVIGFFLEGKRNLESRYPDCKGKGFKCIPNYQGYSQWFGIVNSRVDETDHFDKFENGQKATAATVRNAMAKEFAKVRANRQFLSRFIDLIAKAA